MRKVAGLLGVLLVLLPLVGVARFVVPAPEVDQLPRSALKQLAFVRAAIEDGADVAAQRSYPEGFFFLNALYGLAWVQVGLAEPDRASDAVREARWALARLQSPDGVAPFDKRLRPSYGIFYAGWTNRLLGGVLALQPTEARDPAEVSRFQAASAAIASAFSESGTPFLAAYPGRAWPVDSSVAVASLRLHDRLFGQRYGPVIDAWLSQVQSRLDPATGLVPHQVDASGNQLSGARATSQSMLQRFLAEIEPGFARDQYQRFRSLFVAHPLLLGPAVREYPRGTDGPGDVDSGPLVLGVSLSATVVTLGAARVQRDDTLAAALHHEGELVGVPVNGFDTKRYAFGAVPVADAFLVWSATARPVAAEPLNAGLAWWRRIGWFGLLALPFLLGLGLVRLGFIGRK
jgi:hypothetical protein